MAEQVLAAPSTWEAEEDEDRLVAGWRARLGDFSAWWTVDGRGGEPSDAFVLEYRTLPSGHTSFVFAVEGDLDEMIAVLLAIRYRRIEETGK